MTVILSKGHYRARLAATDGDILATQQLRYRCFITDNEGVDADRFDPVCQHLLIEDSRDGALVACCRFQVFSQGDQITDSYSAQFYDLTAMAPRIGPSIEVGRFCVRPGTDPLDALRVAWGALTRVVDTENVGFLFGCSSFAGMEPALYSQAFAQLARSHLAPPDLRPGQKAVELHEFSVIGQNSLPSLQRALAEMPPLLRSYLTMGGWVSDHAVIDRDLGTLHVFTGVQVARIPAARARVLRALAL